ncbi:unnamed protein product [Vitrella brassicaformis CCMP3155]|uniref:Uncharacterized protein n=2 Tax=Vitrella brassicaformis TaxID=1169539 RepID=A0A0G4FIR2_VITBC|nr:unnamed protein product [Vitrella brassicaformis CCMP3155]|eukprot:CEM12999.1 unnamed protein product [Vitrella brassicaformis CCMP3155]
MASVYFAFVVLPLIVPFIHISEAHIDRAHFAPIIDGLTKHSGGEASFLDRQLQAEFEDDELNQPLIDELTDYSQLYCYVRNQAGTFVNEVCAGRITFHKCEPLRYELRRGHPVLRLLRQRVPWERRDGAQIAATLQGDTQARTLHRAGIDGPVVHRDELPRPPIPPLLKHTLGIY